MHTGTETATVSGALLPVDRTAQTMLSLEADSKLKPYMWITIWHEEPDMIDAHHRSILLFQRPKNRVEHRW